MSDLVLLSLLRERDEDALVMRTRKDLDACIIISSFLERAEERTYSLQ